ncbi:MAG: aminodeoxychorismate synthase component I [Candidatus Omnitrophica bacterium]|nr:aminodeoxychorismate synthase component I [Candidatus Omnitrophota bacterium]MCF7893690.1 aminodeoxychorismate synthase component I [Candidatus Omnitrophota bacterium]
MAISLLTQKKLLRLKPPYLLLDTIRKDGENKKSFLFSDVVETLIFRPKDSVDSFFKKIDNRLKKGFWLTGYFCYEFGYFLEDSLKSLQDKKDTPLVWLLVTKAPQEIKIKNDQNQYREDFLIKNVKPNITKQEYKNKIKKIKYFLKEGFSYQTNFTFKINFDFKGNPLNLYNHLRISQPTSYAALIKPDDTNTFLSFSPELFIRIKKNKVITRPMKGTLSRGKSIPKDKNKVRQFAKSRKIKAENLMITDLLRNDLGRISEKVEVPRLFDIEKYRTLYQMTSTIEAKLKKRKKIKEIFSALFPCGSVTGAPKIKTMEIIRDLEKEPRRIYTGAIGYISPKRNACFNVAIRTLEIKKEKGQLGVGGGILYDSNKEAEYKEALLKADFFTKLQKPPQLIETILWSKDQGFWLLELHLRRLKESCQFFSFSFYPKKIKKKLKEEVTKRNQDTKLRLLLDQSGQIMVSAKKVQKIKSPVKVKIHKKRIDSSSIYLYHKTTKRDFYNQARKKAQKEGFFETIFLNQKNELTEGTITNIFLAKKGNLYTPILSSGLLPGVFRQHLLQSKKAKAKKLYLRDLKKADKIYLGNSVRGLLEAKFIDIL